MFPILDTRFFSVFGEGSALYQGVKKFPRGYEEKLLGKSMGYTAPITYAGAEEGEVNDRCSLLSGHSLVGIQGDEGAGLFYLETFGL